MPGSGEGCTGRSVYSGGGVYQAQVYRVECVSGRRVYQAQGVSGARRQALARKSLIKPEPLKPVIKNHLPERWVGLQWFYSGCVITIMLTVSDTEIYGAFYRKLMISLHRKSA